MANMKDEEEQEESKVESIDASIQNNKNQSDKLTQELNPPTLKPVAKDNQAPSYLDSTFSPSVQTKTSLFVPLSIFNENDDCLNNQSPLPPLRQTSLNYDLNRPLSPDEKLDQLLNEQLKRNYNATADSNNNYSSYDQNNNLPSSSFNNKQYYGAVKPRKINIAQELENERNFNCVPSSSQFNDYKSNYNSNNYNQSPRLWSSNQTSDSAHHPIQIDIQKDKPQHNSNPQLNYTNKANYSPVNYDRSQSQQSSYQIPIINENKRPTPPERQQSLSRTNLQNGEKEIPIQYEEPIQSKSFKILQKLTAGIEDEIEKLKVLDQQNKAYQQQYKNPLEGKLFKTFFMSILILILSLKNLDKLPAYYGTLNHIEQPRIRSERRIPIQVEDSFSSNSTNIQPEYHSKNEQSWIYQNNSYEPFSSFSSPSINSNTSGSFWQQPEWVPQVPASRQPQITSMPKYQGGNIPSRSFRILQMLADDNEW